MGHLFCSELADNKYEQRMLYMKRSNILFVVALAVIVLMVGPLSAMAAPITLNNITEALDATATPGKTCISGGTTCGTHAFGTRSITDVIGTWNVNDAAVNNQPLFDLNWTTVADGKNYTQSEVIDFTFHFSGSRTIVIPMLLTETIGPGTTSPVTTTLSLSLASNQTGTGRVAIPGGEFIYITLFAPIAGTTGAGGEIPVYGSISVPEPLRLMLLPLGLVFVGGIRKRFLA